MRWQDVDSQVCSIARTMVIIGDRWTILIIRELFMGVTKFSSLQKSLDINKNRLSERLSRLVDEGIVEKQVYDDAHNRYEYILTPEGVDLYPVLMSIVRWGDKWRADEDGIPMEFIHTGCGQKADPVYCCSDCGEPVDFENLKPVPGPGVLKKIERGEKVGVPQESYK
jgi:DNA-binding HxlR family transcriptional regulator